MMMVDPTKNCHAYCPYGKMCRYAKGEIGKNPDDCGTYYKMDDLNNEAKDIRLEQERVFEEVDDW